MRAALYFIIEQLTFLYQIVLLVRLLMQLTRADFRNPAARAVVQITDPLILPLRRVLMPLRKIDTASVVAILLVSVAKVLVLRFVSGLSLPAGSVLALSVLRDTVDLVLRTYLYSLFLHALLSLLAQGNYLPPQAILASICNPVLNPIRRLIPAIAGWDLSPLWAMIAIQALLILIH